MAAMAAQGATLQNYNNELVKCVDDLKEKREEVNKAILKDVSAGCVCGRERESEEEGKPARRFLITTASGLCAARALSAVIVGTGGERGGMGQPSHWRAVTVGCSCSSALGVGGRRFAQAG